MILQLHPKNTTSETTNVMKFIKTVCNFEKPIIASVNVDGYWYWSNNINAL